MAKSSAKPLPRWMSAKRDCREARFVQIGNSLLFHEKFRSLSAGAFKLYICCAMEAAGSINFQIPASKAEQYGMYYTLLWSIIEAIDKSQAELLDTAKTLDELNILKGY